MLKIFNKKHDINDMFCDGKWSVHQGQYDGKPIVVRINEALLPYVGKTDYTMRIGFAIPLKQPNEDGLPNQDENKIIEEIEDKITQIITKNKTAIEAMAITMGTFKEFVFYSKPDFNIKNAHETLKKEIISHDVQCYASMDDNWATYTEWAKK